jgi:hypothetical protein
MAKSRVFVIGLAVSIAAVSALSFLGSARASSLAVGETQITMFDSINAVTLSLRRHVLVRFGGVPQQPWR